LPEHVLGAALHEGVGLAVSHEAPVDLVVGQVDEAFKDHDRRHKEYLLLVGEAQVGRSVVQVVEYVVLTDLVDANTVDCYTELGISGTAALPRRPDQRHRLFLFNSEI